MYPGHRAAISAPIRQAGQTVWRWRDRRGIAAVEFAIIAPVLLALIIGMVCFGLYFVYLHELQELASSAARASVAGLSATERDQIARQFVNSATAGSSILNAADLTVSTSTSGTPAVNYVVTLQYSLKDTPIPLLARFVSLPVGSISRTSTVQFGDY